jgi:hypothetical protein
MHKALQQLVQKWRDESKGYSEMVGGLEDSNRSQAFRLNRCADELEALFASPAPSEGGDDRWEPFEKRMWGIFHDEGFPCEVHALFPAEQEARQFMESKQEDWGCCLLVLPVEVSGRMWNSSDDCPSSPNNTKGG